MTARINADGTPTDNSIRNDAAIPHASQIPNNTKLPGEYLGNALETLDQRVVVSGMEVETLNNEQSTAIGGAATDQWCPTTAIIQMVDVGEGTAANGDVQMSIGITAGGTQILAATALTNLIAINTKFVIDLSAVVKPAIPANSTVYVKVTTADTTAGAGHLANAYIYGKIIPTAS